MAPPASEQTPLIKDTGLLGKIKLALSISTIVGLLSTNVATLTSEAAHTTLFDGLKQAIGYAIADATANRLLSHSPTEVRKTDVARKTVALEAEKQALRNTAIVLEGEKQALTKERDVLDQHNQKLSAEHEDLKTKHQKLSADHQGLNERHNKLTADHDSLDQQHRKLTADHSELSTKHNQLLQTQAKRAAAAKKLSDSVAPRVVRTATRAVSSLPAKVAPLAGAALTAGMTLWDIKDMCDTLNDLNVMNVAFGHPKADVQKVCGMNIPSIGN